jgi:DNA-binding transcriptional LysR family regulator
LSLVRLHYFLEVAKYLNFSEASNHLFVSQSAISKQIASLEDELGVKLFNRNKRSVELTHSGVIFLKKATELVKHYEDAVSTTRRAHNGIVGSLKIGVLGYMGFLPQFLKKFQNNFPSIEVHISQLNSGLLINSLIDKNIDLGFTISHDFQNSPNLSWELIGSEEMVVTVPNNHHLIPKKSVHLSDLKDETFIIMSRTEVSEGYHYLVKLCEDAGFSPKISYEVDRMELLFLLLESGKGIAILPKIICFPGNNNHKTLDIIGQNTTYNLGIVWHKDMPNPSLPNFLEELKTELSSSNDFNLIPPGFK